DLDFPEKFGSVLSFNSPPLDDAGSLLPLFASVANDSSFCFPGVWLPRNKKGAIIYGNDEAQLILNNSVVLINSQPHKKSSTL
ncbi:MAG TPA: hypothetical protein DIT57_11230, partial [Enterococcus sp.]|nr:hypothetical protein [Enterococcus sp.]